MAERFLQAIVAEGYDYEAAACAIKIEDIVRNTGSRDILRRLKENDQHFVKLQVTNEFRRDSDDSYCPGGAHDLGWLGYSIGQNTKLKELYLQSNPFEQQQCY